MFQSMSRTFANFFNPSMIIPFVIGAVCLSLLSSALFQLLVLLIGDQIPQVLAIAVTALVVLIGSVWVFAWMVNKQGHLSDPGKQAPAPRRGLILMIGKGGRETGLEAIRHHADTLKRIWLIHSAQTQEIAQRLAAEEEVRTNRDIETRQVDDVNDPQEFFKVIREIYTTLPGSWTVQDVIADYVGMTSHGSVGMVLACLKFDAPLQYTPAVYDPELKALHPLRPLRPLRPFEVMVRLRKTATSEPSATLALPK